MTPKEKAKELFEKYAFVEIAYYTSKHEVKECALIAVNEIIESNMDFDHDDNIWCDTGRFRNSQIYWGKVKQEIEKL